MILTYYDKEISHFGGNCMIDFDITRWLDQICRVFIFRQERIFSIFSDPRMLLDSVSFRHLQMESRFLLVTLAL